MDRKANHTDAVQGQGGRASLALPFPDDPAALKRIALLLHFALDSAMHGIMITGSASTIEYYNPFLLRMLDLSEDAISDVQWKKLLMHRFKNPDRLERIFDQAAAVDPGETLDFLKMHDGRLLECRTRGQFIPALGAGYRLWSFIDCTEQQRRERELQHLGLYDTLTGMHNRAYFDMRLQQLRSTGPYPISMVMIDVDGLKKVNDGRGHPAGDDLLRNAAHILQQARRVDDLVARLGGDEFGVLLLGADQDAAEQVTNRISGLLNLYNIRHPEAPISLSMGHATAEISQDMDSLVSEADAVMYKSRRQRRRR